MIGKEIMKYIYILLIVIGFVACLFVFTGKMKYSQVIKDISSQDIHIRIGAQTEALAFGPAIVPKLRSIKSLEAEAIVNNYDSLTNQYNAKAIKASLLFFSQNNAPSFIADSLKLTNNRGDKINAVRQLDKMNICITNHTLVILADILSKEPIDISGSETATLHDIYIRELVDLIASILGEEPSADQPIEKKIQFVLNKSQDVREERKKCVGCKKKGTTVLD